MNSVLHYMGAVYLSWSLFEINLEMLSKREMGITDLQSHTIFGSLSFSAKRNICIALMKESTDPLKDEIIEAIREVPQLARRNHITHSIIKTSEDFSVFNFVKREVANGLSAKNLKLDAKAMKRHFDDMANAAITLEKLSGFSDADRNAYVDSVKSGE